MKYSEGVYLHLFHGRTDPEQDMQEWGEVGPVIGPFRLIHTTYKYNLRAKDDPSDAPVWDVPIAAHDDMIYFRGVWYGDWTICGHAEADKLVLNRIGHIHPDDLTGVERGTHCSRCEEKLRGVTVSNPATGERMHDKCFNIQFGANYVHTSPLAQLVAAAQKFHREFEGSPFDSKNAGAIALAWNELGAALDPFVEPEQ